ncbi:peptidase [Caldichromatium japonicum]|uniref:Peptidase n=2 Tax=Caldichromatium japonicum TaxID=2699430 RepID=A0A6G7VG71_9GAMM|nr:peptidase [Caldichromatium japonicum]
MLLAGLLGLLSPLSLAHEPPSDRPWDHDHEEARAARTRGEIRPIAEILHGVQAQFPGQLLDVELKKGKKGRPWVYELKLLTADGRRLELAVDACNGRVLKLGDED